MENERQLSKGSPVLSFDFRTVRRLLPQRYPFMLLDRVLAYHPQERRLVGLKLVSRNEPFLQGHFPEYPILPGVLIIEALAQTSGCLMNFDYLIEQGTPVEKLADALRTFVSPKSFLAESKIKHTRPVFPGEQMELETKIVLGRDGMYTFKTCAWVGGEEASKGQLMLARTPVEAAP
jgi:3-hydroxyacyl-[acyl-carrier-protein] dehydratase